MMDEYQISGHSLFLHPDGAVFLPGTKSLIVSDIHLGKAAAFQVRGIPVPEGDSRNDLARIADLLRETEASELIVAGDLFHSPEGVSSESEDLLGSFLDGTDVPVCLAMGNHDLGIPFIPGRIRQASSLSRSGILIVHDPDEAAESRSLRIAGHLHPVIRIRDGKRTSLRLACFWLRKDALVLPSFGGFTGGREISASQGDRVFIPLRGRVRELPETVWIRP